MEKALILTGRVENEESYQLLINCSYVSSMYDSSLDRRKFYDELSYAFAKRILQESSFLELGVFNGLRINPDTGKNQIILKLDDLLVSEFSQLVCEKLKRSAAQTMPACIMN